MEEAIRRGEAKTAGDERWQLLVQLLLYRSISPRDVGFSVYKGVRAEITASGFDFACKPSNDGLTVPFASSFMGHSKF